MALYWDRLRDAPRLVTFLSPPAPPDQAEANLGRVWRQLANELYDERTGRQSTKQVKQELESLQKALSCLSPRTRSALARAIETRSERLPAYPPPQEPLLTCPSLVGRLSGVFALHLLSVSIDEVLENTPRLRRGHPGKTTDVTRRGISMLVELFCHCHNAPRPSWDVFAEQVRHPAALEFAFECLRAWYVPGIDRLEPGKVARSLHNYSGRNQTE